jgi:hypothetical protein
MKICSKCKIEQPLDNFVNNKNYKDGKHGTCKACVKVYQLQNQDKLKAYQKQYQPGYKQENYGNLLAYQQIWKATNKDKCIAYAKKSLAKPEVAAKKKAYMTEYSKLWRARKKSQKQNG